MATGRQSGVSGFSTNKFNILYEGVRIAGHWLLVYAGTSRKEIIMREQISQALKVALKGQERRRVATLRLINAAITDRDIALRGNGKDRADDAEILDILTKMVKQREESSRLYREAGRSELEAQELEEIEIIREFLPKALSEEETGEAIRAAITETGAQSLRDMGKVMGLLKERYRGQIDMAKAGARIKAELGT
jgi:hypothetical protein